MKSNSQEFYAKNFENLDKAAKGTTKLTQGERENWNNIITIKDIKRYH